MSDELVGTLGFVADRVVIWCNGAVDDVQLGLFWTLTVCVLHYIYFFIGFVLPNFDFPIIENIKKRVEVSAHHHGSKILAIAGHFGCAGNPTGKEVQIAHLKKAEEIVKSFDLNVEIILLWVDGDWTTVEKV